jgi:Ca2+-binding EF-hand superfamily protein
MRPHVFIAMTLLALPLTVADTAAQTERTMRFRAMDANGDGVITREEWRGSDQSFRVHDWNGDGRLSGDEVRLGGTRQRPADDQDFEQARRREFTDWTAEGFRNHDHNSDGRISRSEWHYDVESFRRADRNGDGILSRNEFLNSDVDADLEDRFDYLDANNNGRLERSEWHASRDAFEWLDRNNDNTLTRAEVVGEGATAQDDLLTDLDDNRDGRVSMNEWHWSRRSFERRDRNGDGQLTRAELGSVAGSPGAVGTAGRRVVVNPTQRWIDTGIDVRTGDRVTIQADGTIGLSTNSSDSAGPEGSASGRRAENAPLRDHAAGALIARIGGSGPIFIGNSGTIDRAPANGRLYLGVNDDHLADNTGQYQAMITVDRP